MRCSIHVFKEKGRKLKFSRQKRHQQAKFWLDLVTSTLECRRVSLDEASVHAHSTSRVCFPRAASSRAAVLNSWMLGGVERIRRTWDFSRKRNLSETTWRSKAPCSTFSLSLHRRSASRSRIPPRPRRTYRTPWRSPTRLPKRRLDRRRASSSSSSSRVK